MPPSPNEAEALKVKNPNSDEKFYKSIREEFGELKEDREKFKRLYEANRRSEKIMKDRIYKAVRIAIAE